MDNATFILGMTGQFVKEAPIVCGGKSAFENIDKCFEFNVTENEWHPIPKMSDKRYYASSVLDENGDLWVSPFFKKFRKISKFYFFDFF
jgi:hypothetical protein